MASRLTIWCKDADEAATLAGLLERRLAEKRRSGRFGLKLDGRRVEALDAEASGAPPRSPAHPATSGELAELAAGAAGELIARHLEPRLIARMIAGRVMDMGAEELEDIKDVCFRMLNGPEGADGSESGPLAEREAGIVRRLAAHLEEQPVLDIEGFLRFRLADYRAFLKETVDLALEEYAADRQYREFISLLKYFVHFQEAKIPRANLVHCGDNRYVMLDHRLQPLKWGGAGPVTVETVDRELNCEDMVVSTLIAASPAHIIIHTREPDAPSIRTIRQIFEGRTTLCTSCAVCGQAPGREEELGRT